MSIAEVWDELKAHSEGWSLGTESGKPKVLATPGRFGCGKDPRTWVAADVKALAFVQAKALAFVQQKAREGSAYHIEALARTQLL